jgi:hypothetical protein
MTTSTAARLTPTLSDVVTRLLDTGAVVLGRSTISLSGIDLIHLELKLLLSSVETLRENRSQMAGLAGRLVAPMMPDVSSAAQVAVTTTAAASAMPSAGDAFTEAAADVASGQASALQDLPADADVARGLAHLVLTLVELLRQVVEQQALRRVEGGGLSDDEIERVGVALQSLEEQMERLKDVFGIQDDELHVNLNLLGLS